MSACGDDNRSDNAPTCTDVVAADDEEDDEETAGAMADRKKIQTLGPNLTDYRRDGRRG